jgi:peptidoglycan/xylan/chitin deacetylase (PgdA/CDA1 family)
MKATLGGIPNKRERLARALGGTGVLGLLEGITHRWRPYLAVLTYHRIAESGTDLFYEPVISATPESFRAQVQWLRSRLHLVTLKELIEQVQTGSPWRKPAVLLTFDDAYRDNFDVAVPILREFEVPATFFVPTGFLETPRLPWWDTVAYAIKKAQVRQLTLDRNRGGNAQPLVIDLETTTRTMAITTIIHAFLSGTIDDERWFLDQLATKCKVAIDHEMLGRALFMNWEQVRRVADSGAGLSIGSHGNEHHRLAALDEDGQRYELVRSKQVLEARLDREVAALAYPYGWPGTYTARTKTLASDAGYRLAFTSREGVNRPHAFDAHEIRRLGVGSGDSVALLRGRVALYASAGRSFL